MRIAIVGAGAMGQLFGARLTLAGQDVVLVDAQQSVIDTLNSAGIWLETEKGTEHTAVVACRAEEETEPFDLFVIFTKSFHTAAAVASVRHLIGPQSVGLTVQNGLGHAEVLAEAFGPDGTVAGVTDFPADLLEVGRVHSTVHGSVRIGDLGEGGRAESVARVFSDAGLNASVDGDVRVPIWEKVAFNAALNTLSAVTGATVGEMGASAEARAMASAVVLEVGRVAAARGIGMSVDRVTATLANAFEHHGSHKSSMLVDREAGRRTEVDYIGGAVVDSGRSAGVPTPVLETLCSLVRMLTEEPLPR
ncbi:ketopantoate reductase family protein [Microbacterium sp. A93]|uniref:ketopantoate reductase family protein n=1 Tax=Microbacterium sp. A93 TaxID=3450716 RepID=UPI003F435DFC